LIKFYDDLIRRLFIDMLSIDEYKLRMIERPLASDMRAVPIGNDVGPAQLGQGPSDTRRSVP
jgi:hypothetical protein